jgi:hypothetical protein
MRVKQHDTPLLVFKSGQMNEVASTTGEILLATTLIKMR